MKLRTFSILSFLLVFTLISCSKKKVAEDSEVTDDISSIEDTDSGLAPGAKIPGIAAVFFAYDSFSINSDGRAALEAAAAWLNSNPNQSVQIEGHCDERGTTEYNLALGERRAVAVRDYLVSLGVAGSQLSTISYGEERPSVPGFDDSAYSQNRRAEFVAAGY